MTHKSTLMGMDDFTGSEHRVLTTQDGAEVI